MAIEASCKDIEQHLKALLKASVEKSEAKEEQKNRSKQKHKTPDQYEDNFPALPDQPKLQKSSNGKGNKRQDRTQQGSGELRKLNSSKPDIDKQKASGSKNPSRRNKYKNTDQNEIVFNGSIQQREVVDLKKSDSPAKLNNEPVGLYNSDPAVISVKESFNTTAGATTTASNNVALQSLLSETMKSNSQGTTSGNNPAKESLEVAKSKIKSRNKPKKKLETEIKRTNSEETLEREAFLENYETTVDSDGVIVGIVEKTLAKTLAKEQIFTLAKQSDRFPKACFFCRICSFHCDYDNLEHHMRGDRHKSFIAMQNKENMLRNLPFPTKSQTKVVGDLIDELYEKESLTKEDLQNRQDIVNELNITVKSHSPDIICKFQLYGSSVSKFGLKSSDVNIDMIVNSVEELSEVLSVVLDILNKDEQFDEVKSDFQAKMPTIAFKHSSTNLSCNITWNNTASLQTAILLAKYAAIDERVLKLGIALRYWAKLCLLDQQTKGTLPSHSYIIMLIYFLQQQEPPVLPVLQELANASQESSSVKPVVGIKPDSTVDSKEPAKELSKPEEPLAIDDIVKTWKSENVQTVGELWIELLRFYSVDFMPNQHIVCIRRLLPLTRAERKWDGKVIAIEDPSSRKRNLSRSIANHHVYRYIAERFQDAYKYFGIPQFKNGPLYDILPTELYKKSWRCKKAPKNDTSNVKQNVDIEKTDRKRSSNSTSSENNKLHKKENQKLIDFDSEYSSEDDDFMDGHDPDLSFDEVADTLLNLNLNPRHLRTESESSDIIWAKHLATEMDISEEKDKTAAASSDIQNKSCTQLNLFLLGLLSTHDENDMIYSFNSNAVIGTEKPPIYCRFCQREGHLCDECPSQILPDLIPLPTMTPQFQQCLDKSCQQVMEDCFPSEREREDRKNILYELQKIVQKIYPDAKLELFGSSCNGFGFVGSDIDICLTFAGNHTGEGLDYVSIIEELAKHLQDYKILTNILAIKTAKVPIVKFTHIKARVECDISLYNTLAQHNTRMLKLYCEIDSRVQILGYAIKLFAKLCDIGDASRGSLSSYAYILMVLHFLQQRKPPVIPVLQELYDKNETKPEVIVDGWNAWFFDKLDKLDTVWPEMGLNKESSGSLLLGLLRYYTEDFNFKESVITIRQLGPLSRFQKVWNSKSIAIEDPFDLNHNLGVGVSINMNTYIMKALIRGREIFGQSQINLPRDPLTFFFNKDKLMLERPPNDHGCRICRKIGHKMKDCPNRKDQNRNRNRNTNRNSNNDSYQQDQRMRQQFNRMDGGGPNYRGGGGRDGNYMNQRDAGRDRNFTNQRNDAGRRPGNQEQRPTFDVQKAVRDITSVLKSNPQIIQPQGFPGKNNFVGRGKPGDQQIKIQPLQADSKHQQLMDHKQRNRQKHQIDVPHKLSSSWPQGGSGSGGGGSPGKQGFPTHPLTGNPIGNRPYANMEAYTKNMDHLNHHSGARNSSGQNQGPQMHQQMGLFKHPPPPSNQSRHYQQQQQQQQQHAFHPNMGSSPKEQFHSMPMYHQFSQPQQHHQQHQKQQHDQQRISQQRPNIMQHSNQNQRQLGGAIHNTMGLLPNPQQQAPLGLQGPVSDFCRPNPQQAPLGLQGPPSDFCRPPMPSPFSQAGWVTNGQQAGRRGTDNGPKHPQERIPNFRQGNSNNH